MSKMKIAFLTPEYPHPAVKHSAGIGTSIYNLVQGLIGLDCEIHVLVYGQDVDEVIEGNGFMIHTLRNVKFKGLSWYLTRKKLEAYINQLCADEGVDILEVPDWTGISSFIKLKKCPIVIKLNGSDTYFCKLENRPLKIINYWHERRALSNANAHIAVSQFVAQKTNTFFKLDLDFSIIPNGINTTYFQPQAFRENLGHSQTILYLGTLIRKKGVLDLPHIFNQVVEDLPQAKLILVGSDASDVKTGSSSTWELMQEAFTDVAIENVEYQGKVPYAQVSEYIENADVCVFPSYAEALPVSWIECMAMGKALVASSIGWGKEVIQDGENGLLAHPADYKGFSNRILEILMDVTLKQKLEKGARERVLNHFDAQVIAQKTLDFYKKVLKQTT